LLSVLERKSSFYLFYLLPVHLCLLLSSHLYVRGLQCFKLNGNQTENGRYAECYSDFKFVDAGLKKYPWKKLEPKNYANFENFCFCAFFRGFLLLIFVRVIYESRHQRIWNQHKIVWVIIALFANFKCKCEKNCTFSNILQKVKSYFFDNIYQSPFDCYWNFKKSIKFKPPTVHIFEATWLLK
jgi:hypothetical protein